MKAVEHHLADGFTYSERPPTHEYPLEAFLFEDKIGYCQQFSGAMALMLRMSGIPARVVSGFSPGSLNRDTGEYRVRDLDAHSWVEVYFTDIGWVTFDPTPAAAPADRAGQGPSNPLGDRPQPGAANASSLERPELRPRPRPGAAGGRARRRGRRRPAPDRDPGRRCARGGSALRGWRLRARWSRERDPEAGLRELERALPRLGWPVPAGTTLLELERRLGRDGGPGAPPATWPACARAATRRGAPGPPGRAARRALRRELTVGGRPARPPARLRSRCRRGGPRFRRLLQWSPRTHAA